MEERNFSERNDMTSGVEWKKLLLFALPIMAGQFLQQLYNTVDGIVVGNVVGDAALGAVGACTSLAFLFLAFSIGFGNGCGVVISQLYGAKRMEDLKSAVATALVLLTGMGLAALAIGLFGARPLVTGLLNIKSSHLITLAVDYFAIYSFGLVFQYLYNCIAAILRAVGDSNATLYFLCVSAVLNLVLDVLFVAKFRWRVKGAAIATVISQLVCVIVCFVYMFGKYPFFRFRKGEFRFSLRFCTVCLKMGIPMTIQQCIVSFGNVFMQRLVNHFQDATMAAFTCGVRFENYAMIPALSTYSAMSMFTGQNIGAGRLDRVERGFAGAVKIAVCITLVISTILFAGAYPLAGLFGVEGVALKQAVEYIRFISYAMVLFAVYQATIGVIHGSGDVLFATLCSLFSLALRVLLAYVLVFVFDFGYAMCWQTVPAGWVLCLTMALMRYKGGQWKHKTAIGGTNDE